MKQFLIWNPSFSLPVIALQLTIFVLVVGFGFWISNSNWIWQEVVVDQLAKISNSENIEKENIVEIRIFAAGDIMLDRGVEYMIKKYGNNDYRFPFLKIADDLQGADILFGNLESVISNKGQKVGSIYSFQAEPESIQGLEYAGFNIVSVANNHIFDYGRKGMENSFTRLGQAGIDYVGGGFSKQQACSMLIKNIKGVKIGFLGFTNKGSGYWVAESEQSGICWLDKNIEEIIKKAKNTVDLIIVSMHWGNEYQVEPNKEQKYFGYLAIESGADLIIGHHPHVVQPIEQYKHGWIAYSLGNFIFDQGFSQETMKGALLEILIQGKEIKKVIPKELQLNQFFQPALVKG